MVGRNRYREKGRGFVFEEQPGYLETKMSFPIRDLCYLGTSHEVRPSIPNLCYLKETLQVK